MDKPTYTPMVADVDYPTPANQLNPQQLQVELVFGYNAYYIDGDCLRLRELCPFQKFAQDTGKRLPACTCIVNNHHLIYRHIPIDVCKEMCCFMANSPHHRMKYAHAIDIAFCRWGEGCFNADHHHRLNYIHVAPPATIPPAVPLTPQQPQPIKLTPTTMMIRLIETDLNTDVVKKTYAEVAIENIKKLNNNNINTNNIDNYTHVKL